MSTETGRTAVVTGASGGIGSAIAARLARDGFDIAILELPGADCSGVLSAVEGEGRVALVVEADVTDSQQVEEAVSEVAVQLTPPTVLVNNAGVTRDDLLFKMSVENWDLVMNVHLRGAFNMTKAVQQHMVAARWGRIVNLSSVSALGARGQANYSAAKAGLQGFTKTLAIELGKFGITANAIAPGFIETAMTKATAERIGMDFDEFKDQARAGIPVNRVGQPEDVAAVVAFLARDDSSFVSGQVIYVGGGPFA